MIRATQCFLPSGSSSAVARLAGFPKPLCSVKTPPRWRAMSRPRALSSSSNKNTASSAGWLSAGLAWYATKLDTHPLTTKCISSGLVSAAGDMICQYLTLPPTCTDSSSQHLSNTSWDMARTGRFACLGAFWVGPVLHHWYGYLALLSKRVWVRVAIDQFACAPIFVTSFLAWLWWWEGESPSTLPSRLQHNVPSIVLANWTLWIPAQAVNFTLVPVKYHVLFSNFVALLWNAYLSYTSHNSNDDNSKSASSQEENSEPGEET
ncbi:Peroxisomal membrane protein 2 [Seminavis robusta]|uniref:Peroxisomal membrane protein 2 n=1 Tax=Seminavis robusta TaxID=568900 RepID=A0A9N8E1J1_9STRA|nr:Peroxisomal membrane protein 2 [Seminavis robusta]|eukprot:Sro440_g143350.1 Peroxisomal membrane protein 2 (263) ;mRNA; f:8591-9379